MFIPHGEEQRLLREPDPLPRDEGGDISQLPLGQRLHAARQRKRITLVQAELETRPPVRMHYIQAMEEEKFSLLPRGPVAEELLRIYAAYVGIDANQALDEYRRLHFTTPIEPPPALGGTVLAWRPPRWAVLLVAAVLALAVGCGGIWFYDPGRCNCAGWACPAADGRLDGYAYPNTNRAAHYHADSDASPFGDANRHRHADRDGDVHARANRHRYHIAHADAPALASSWEWEMGDGDRRRRSQHMRIVIYNLQTPRGHPNLQLYKGYL